MQNPREPVAKIIVDELGKVVDQLHRTAEMMEERYGLNGEIPVRDREAADWLSEVRKRTQRGLW